MPRRRQNPDAVRKSAAGAGKILAMESQGSRRHVRTEDLLPPPPMGKALLFGGVAAVVGAAAWALLLIFANVEHGALAWGVGGLIGFAVVKGGGYGQMLAVSAAVLAVLSIGSGKHISYTHFVGKAVDESAQQLTSEMHAEIAQDAKDWAALGAAPTDEQIEKYVLDHNYDADSIETFRAELLPMIEWFRDEQPSLEQWRDRQRGELEEYFANEYSFVAYLKEDFHLFDIVFVILGLATAFGLVSRHTTDLQVAARQELRAEREAEQAEEEGEEEGAAERDDDQPGTKG